MDESQWRDLVGRIGRVPQYQTFIDVCIQHYQGTVTKMMRVVADYAYEEGRKDGMALVRKEQPRG